jgi:ADP-ribose pyrophosphatase
MSQKEPTSSLLYKGRYLTLKSRDGWEYVAREHDVACIIAWTPARELLLVEQYRIPVAARTIELPAGLVGDQADQSGEAIEDAARRELEEETGWRAGHLEPIMRCPTSAGMSDESVMFFFAEDLVQTGPGGGDSSEDILVHRVGHAGIDEWLAQRNREGYALDPKIFAALHWSRNRP